MSVVAKRLDGLRWHLVWTMEVGIGPGDFVFDGDPRTEGIPTTTQFWPMFIVAKWLNG